MRIRKTIIRKSVYKAITRRYKFLFKLKMYRLYSIGYKDWSIYIISYLCKSARKTCKPYSEPYGEVRFLKSYRGSQNKKKLGSVIKTRT